MVFAGTLALLSNNEVWLRTEQSHFRLNVSAEGLPRGTVGHPLPVRVSFRHDPTTDDGALPPPGSTLSTMRIWSMRETWKPQRRTSLQEMSIGESQAVGQVRDGVSSESFLQALKNGVAVRGADMSTLFMIVSMCERGQSITAEVSRSGSPMQHGEHATVVG